MEKAVDKARELLKEFKLDVGNETLYRYVEVLNSVNRKRESLADIVNGIFDEDYMGMVIEKNIPIYSYCIHHILPWFGLVHIGYISNGKVLGLSKFKRVVDYYSSGLTLQERVCNSISRFFEEHVSPDVIVYIEAIHTCKVARGTENPYSKSITVDAKGIFRESSGARIEFFNSIGLGINIP